MGKLEDSDLFDQIKIQKKITEKLEKEKEKSDIYLQLFKMMSEEDRNYILKSILRNIECDLREKGIYEENKKELKELKKAIEDGIKYDF